MSFSPAVLRAGLTSYRRSFPSTESEAEEEWEEVEGGESAENGPAVKEGEEYASKITLPDVPSGEPTDGGPASKKQKQDDEEKL